MRYFIGYLPEDKIYGETPARFTWPPQKENGLLSVRVYRDMEQTEQCYRFDDIDINFFTPDEVMESDVYYWCLYGENGKIFGPQRFEIAQNATHTPLPPRDRRYESIKAHPRILFNEEHLPEIKDMLRTDLKEEMEQFIEKSVNKFADMPPHTEPPKYPEDIRDLKIWRSNYILCQECLYAIRHCAFVYKMQGGEKYLEAAKKWLMNIAGWDLDGSTARRYNDEAGFRVTTALAWGYDWLYDELDSHEKALIRDILLRRGRELYEYIKNDIQIHVKLLDSHGVRSVSMTLVPAALALFGEEKEATDWLNYAVEYYMTIFTPWGGDEGGWAEGPAYWQMGMAFVTDALNLIKNATGINIFHRPFFQNTGDFPLFTYCHDLLRMAFCDMSDLGEYPQLKAGFITRHLATVTKNENKGYYQWYYNQARKRNKGTENMFFNYGWWSFDFDDIVFKLRNTPIDEKRPPDGVIVKWFKDIGWVLIHKNMADENKHVALMIKSSPYGSVSHSHGDQNAFVLHAYGEPLAIYSGYYVGFWTEMHVNWRRQTKSKNAVLIDGIGQYADLKKNSKSEELNGSGKSQFEGLLSATGTIEEVSQNGDNVYVRGDATNAYLLNIPYLKSCKRHYHFLGGDVIEIIDEIELAKEGSVSWLLHGLRKFEINGASFELKGNKASLSGSFVYVSAGEVTIDQTDEFEGVSAAETEGLEKQWHLRATTGKAMSHKIITLLKIKKA